MSNISRREYLKYSGLAALGASVAGSPLNAQDRPPNIVYILTDDQHFNTLGCYGGNVLTPHIDGLARDGMRFTRAYANSSVCVPSRYSTLTGRYAGRCSHSDYLSQYPPGTLGRISNHCISLERDGLNLPSVLQSEGYATSIVGKWHLGPLIHQRMGNTPQDIGFQEFDPNGDPEDPAISAALKHNQQRICDIVKECGFDYAGGMYWANLKEVNNKQLNVHNIDWTVKNAHDFMERYQKQPFFLYFSTTMHHGPPPQQSIFKNDQITGEGIAPERFKMMPTRESIRTRLRDAGFPEETAYCTWLDDAVGALLNKLEELGVADNTLVVYNSDHGTTLKSSLYEGGVHVPLIMRWPGHIQAGTECDTLVQNIDFAPTFMDIARATAPPGMPFDGVSLTPLFEGNHDLSRESLYFEIGYARAVCTNDWKYIAVRYPADIQGQLDRGDLKVPPNYITNRGLSKRAQANPNYFAPDQLFDLRNDPQELNNLAENAKYTDKVREMRALLGEYLRSFPDRPFGEFA